MELASAGASQSTYDIKWGEEVTRLYPPLVYAAGLRSDGDSPPTNLDDLLKQLSASQAPYLPTCTLKHNHDVEPFMPSGLPILTSLLLNENEHTKVIQAGKVNGTSVTGNVAGILAILTYKYNETQDAKSVSIWGAATDRRTRIPDKYKPFYGQAI